MKLINNQQTRLYDELKVLLTEESEVLISASYISIISFFELSTELKKVASIKILIDNDSAQNTLFGYAPQEY